MITDGFIKDISILQENSRVDDLLDLSEYVSKYLEKIEGYSDKSMFALKGRFGIGKSTFLHQLERVLDENNSVKWFEFDAWKYPDRANLWESFVLELAQAIDEKNFNLTIRKIEGKTPSLWVEKFVSFGSGFLGSIKNFNDFLNTSPAKRTFEVQEILLDLINTLGEETLYVVIEDIDRSGDSGIYFLETLNHFIKNEKLLKKIKIIVPISNESYIENKSSYHKCFDYINDYDNPEYKLDKFCKEIFTDNITGKTGEGTYGLNTDYVLLLEFLEGLFRYYNNDFTLRELKLLLRNANEKYKSLLRNEGEGINPIICIMVEASKITIGNADGDSMYAMWKQSNEIGAGSLFSALLLQMNEGSGTRTLYEDHKKEKLNYTLPHRIRITDFKLSSKGDKKDIYFHNAQRSHGNQPDHLYMGKFYFKD